MGYGDRFTTPLVSRQFPFSWTSREFAVASRPVMAPRVHLYAVFQRLTTLDVSGNELESLPAKFGELRWLRVARLSHNQLADMRPFVGLRACEELDLSHNKLADVPDTISQMTSLVTLDLARNDIKEMPTGLCKACRRRHFHRRTQLSRSFALIFN